MFSKLKINIEQLFNRWPITFRIMAWYSIFLTLMLLMLATFVFQFSHRWETSEVRDRLQRITITAASDLRSFKPYREGVFFITYTQEGLITRGALPDGFPTQTPMSPNQVSEILTENSTYYYYDTPIHSPEFSGWFRAIAPIRNTDTRTLSMMYGLLLGTVAFLMIASIGAYILIKRGLKPLRNITNAARLIGKNNDLSQRLNIPDGGRDELYELTTTFNGMLDSLENSSNREKRFNSDVSHELRTPIAVIQASSEFALKHAKNLDTAKEELTHILTQAKFMTALVSQLLDITRLDQAHNVVMDTLDATDMLQGVAQDYTRLCTETNVTFTADIAPNLMVHGHAVSLRRAIGNIIDNAIKFTNSTIHLSAYREGPSIFVKVTDNGEGIEQENLSRIWDRLYQTDKSRNRNSNKGIGLGLYFVSKVVGLHHGQVKAESEPNVATSFIIELPAMK